MKEKLQPADEPKSPSKRAFLRGAGAAALLVAGAPLESLAESIRNACDPGGEDKLLEKACAAELDPVEKARLVEALRSSVTFGKMAEHLPIPKKEKISMLYPGAGSHIAPMVLARTLLEKRPELQEVELCYTEINEREVARTIKNIQNLCTLDPSYRLLKEEIQKEPYNGGTITRIPVRVGEKRIVIRYMLNCSGEEYFDQNSFLAADAFIEHDSGNYLEERIGVVSMALESARKTGHNIPVALEDMRRMVLGDSPVEQRLFDLEPLGRFQRIPGFYGHRGEKLVRELGEDEDVVKTERGESACTGAAILMFHPELLKAPRAVSEAVIATGITALKSGDRDEMDAKMLFSTVRSGDEAAETLGTISPELRKGFVLRQLGAFINIFEGRCIETFIQTYSADSPGKGFDELFHFAARVEERLGSDQRFHQLFRDLRDALSTKEEAYPLYAEAEDALKKARGYAKEHNLSSATRHDGTDAVYEELWKRWPKLNDQWLNKALHPFSDRWDKERDAINHEADGIFDSFDSQLKKF